MTLTKTVLLFMHFGDETNNTVSRDLEGARKFRGTDLCKSHLILGNNSISLYDFINESTVRPRACTCIC